MDAKKLEEIKKLQESIEILNESQMIQIEHDVNTEVESRLKKIKRKLFEIKAKGKSAVLVNDLKYAALVLTCLSSKLETVYNENYIWVENFKREYFAFSSFNETLKEINEKRKNARAIFPEILQFEFKKEQRKLVFYTQQDLVDFFAKQIVVHYIEDYIRKSMPDYIVEFEKTLESYGIPLDFLFTPIDSNPLIENVSQNEVLITKENDKSLLKDNLDVLWDRGEVELTKLIYALIHSRYLKAPNGIEKAVESVFNAFNKDLGSSWQSNHSHHKNDNNADFDRLKFFDNLKTAYTEILDKKERTKKKKSDST